MENNLLYLESYNSSKLNKESQFLKKEYESYSKKVIQNYNAVKNSNQTYDFFSSISLNSQIINFQKKYSNVKDEIDINFNKILSVFSIFLESNLFYFFPNIFEMKDDNFSYVFKFNIKGKYKEIQAKREKDKEFNYFDLLYKNYSKCKKMMYFYPEVFNELTDIIYDFSGLPIIELSLKNKLVLNKVNKFLKSLLDNQNYILILCNEEEENERQQLCYKVLTFFESNELCEVNEYIVNEGETSDFLQISNDGNDKIKKIEVPKILLKLRKLNMNTELNTLYDYKYLLEDRSQNINDCKELYPLGKSNYTYISLPELQTTFSKILLIEKCKFEKQFNGKFIKCLRYDGVTEYKSRWLYSFNISSDSFEITIGIHQTIPNSYCQFLPYIFTGLVILKSNTPLMNFVDYLPLKECRQDFIKLKLSKGSYVLIPM